MRDLLSDLRFSLRIRTFQTSARWGVYLRKTFMRRLLTSLVLRRFSKQQRCQSEANPFKLSSGMTPLMKLSSPLASIVAVLFV